jgi:ubiquinone/menaquinone biosynthesis C-methylase UbiE
VLHALLSKIYFFLLSFTIFEGTNKKMSGFPSSIKKIPKQLAGVYAETDTHLEVAIIIKKHLAHQLDIREVALSKMDLSDARSILDLGCGFGFFTRGLKGRVHPRAIITGIDCHTRYESLFLNACRESDLGGKFSDQGVELLKKFPSNTYDLAVCSYALYFFPEFIGQIARVLKTNGRFVIITHARPHMKAFTDLVRQILSENSIKKPAALPYELLIKNFSNENGLNLLKPWFAKILSKESTSTLVFDEEGFNDFEKFFRFKKTFFVPVNFPDPDYAANIVLSKLKEKVKSEKELKISKEDYIFVCERTNI